MTPGLASRFAARAAIALIYLFLLAPIIVVVVVSLNRDPFLSFPPKGLTLAWYWKVFARAEFAEAFERSLGIAVVTAAVALALGVPAALALVRARFRGKDGVVTFFTMPLMLPAIVLGLALLLAFSRLRLVATPFGLVLAHLVITLPYVIRTTMASVAAMESQYEEAAMILGATPWRTFRRVTLPLVSPGIIAGGVIAFLLSFDELVLTLFLSGPRFKLLSVAIYHYVDFNTDPLVAALSTILILISLAGILIVERAVGLAGFMREGRARGV